jgi:hypothetical protein
MRASTHDDCITSKIADRLIARLAAQHGLRWPAAAPAAARRQPDLLHAEVIKNIDPDEIENLGRELILWRLQDLIRRNPPPRPCAGARRHGKRNRTLKTRSKEMKEEFEKKDKIGILIKK